MTRMNAAMAVLDEDGPDVNPQAIVIDGAITGGPQKRVHAMMPFAGGGAEDLFNRLLDAGAAARRARRNNQHKEE